ncbi:YigZ family protein [Candidatus Arthromitus sp. SFB-rat-Yit]|uniref:YigZ family protein n=1 Tax=Candidatus Arthromitus sp. SFB-rat-Yit TaxID=1041504 RepID=UPI000227A171|nr:YigZ family protein [Candidatus Arthromitus sp. SFB-rat-Yit]BAK81295.1 hypothetical protein RATSFB_0733 [Candidatus Arthromitus sp. SFB-rat-Yit]
MDYKTIIGETEYKFEEKKSIFIGYIKHIESEYEAKKFIDDIKTKHHEARHNVYAYVIGNDMLIQRYTDDGEPRGTAGIPIIELIKKRGLTDIIVVVTRYFGGILLGVGGLTRAYVNGASGVIDKAKIVDRVLGKEISIIVPYEIIGKLQYFFDVNKIHVDNVLYEEKVIFKVRIEKIIVNKLLSDITDLTSNNFDVEISDDVMYFKNEGRYFLNNEIQ